MALYRGRLSTLVAPPVIRALVIFYLFSNFLSQLSDINWLSSPEMKSGADSLHETDAMLSLSAPPTDERVGDADSASTRRIQRSN